MRKVMLVVMILAAGVACSNVPESREQAKEYQENAAQRSSAEVPPYISQNFLRRQIVNKWMERMDVPGKTFFIYVRARGTGQVIEYHVSNGPPVNLCTLLTPPDQTATYDRGITSVAAPQADGVYSGGGGQCDAWYFFDANTDALVHLVGSNLIISDQPLEVKAEPLRVEAAQEEQ